MFSLKKGVPIASIYEKGNGKDKEVGKLYLNLNSKKSDDSDDEEIKINKNIIKELNNLKNTKKINKIRQMLQNDYDSSDDEDDKNLREFNVEKDQYLKVLPSSDPEQRHCAYVFGPSGSGKSTWISNYADGYKKMYPKNPVILFSRLDEDESIDKINPTRIELGEDLLDNPIKPEDLPASLLIFDDTDTIKNKKIRNELNELKSDLLETGRHNNINVVIVSHLASNYKETRIVLNESNYIVFFPRCGATQQIMYVLKGYCGLGKKDIEKIMSLQSRWVCLSRRAPMFVLHEYGSYLL